MEVINKTYPEDDQCAKKKECGLAVQDKQIRHRGFKNRELTARANRKDKKIPIPPHLAIDLAWTFRSPGSSTAPNLIPSLPVRGVRTRESTRAMIKIARIVVISS